jgi:outer membrane murein-binding lipoprotein Lpp
MKATERPTDAGLVAWEWCGVHRHWAHGILVACLAVWLAGCATSADPHKGGFVSGVVGLAGGGYQRRIDEREGTYQGELNAQERLKAEARALEQERAAVRGDLDRAKARLASQERRIAQERARLTAERQKSAATRKRLRQLDQAQAKATRTKGELRSVRPEDQPVTDLKTRTQDINRELDQIDSMVSVVSGTRF